MMIGANLAANCQDKSDTTCLPTTDFDTLLSKFSDYREEVQSLRQLKEDTARLNRAIVNYQNVIRIMNEQKAFNKQQPVDVKRWGIGPAAGGGLTGNSLGAFIGFVVSWSLARW